MNLKEKRLVESVLFSASKPVSISEIMAATNLSRNKVNDTVNELIDDYNIKRKGEALWVSPLSYLESSTPGTAGWIDTPNQRLSIRHLLPISKAEDLAKVAVADEQGLLLKDVARVVEDHQPLIGDAVFNQGPGLLLVIE